MKISNQTRRKWAKRVAFCWEQQDLLTDWELGFIEDMDRLIDSGTDLRLGQSYKLNEIYHKVEEEIG